MTDLYYEDTDVALYHGDCVEVLAGLPEASVDAVVTDPPYGISFMGKEWDQPGKHGSQRRNGSPAKAHRDGNDGAGAMDAGRYDLSAAAMVSFQSWVREWAAECRRVLKPGGYLLAFGGSRTWHRLAAGIEDAGFEIRDSIAWLYGSGFPKSLNVSQAIDAHFGAERPVIGMAKGAVNGSVVGLGQAPSMPSVYPVTAPVTAPATAWEGWGTALKPSFEPIVVARKPLEGTVAANVLTHGTGALHINACRVGDGSESHTREGEASARSRYSISGGTDFAVLPGPRGGSPAGRWPTNVLLDEGQAAALDRQSGTLASGVMRAGTQRAPRDGVIYGRLEGDATTTDTYGDAGGASRFFPIFRYEAKAPTSERPNVDGVQHPTVKPVALMQWLVRLVAPPGATVLEPFAGSGTTLEACIAEGVSCIGIDREKKYLPLIRQRLTKPITPAMDLWGGETA